MRGVSRRPTQTVMAAGEAAEKQMINWLCPSCQFQPANHYSLFLTLRQLSCTSPRLIAVGKLASKLLRTSAWLTICRQRRTG